MKFILLVLFFADIFTKISVIEERRPVITKKDAMWLVLIDIAILIGIIKFL